MAKEVVWTKIILETFLEESGILDRIELGDERKGKNTRRNNEDKMCRMENIKTGYGVWL